MTMANHETRPGRIDDADLVRYLDGELDADTRARIERAVDADPELAVRLDTLRRRGSRLHRLLSETDPPVPAARPPAHGTAGPRAWDRPLLRAAAIVGLLAAVVAAVPPLRAWVVDTLFRGGGEPAPVDVVPFPHELRGTADTMTVQFAVPAPTFDIELINPQRGGRLTIRVIDADRGSAELATRGGGENLLAIPAGLRIINSAASTASYVVEVPSTVRAIRVRMPGSPLLQYPTLDPANRERVIEFGRS
jgi:hypothetical protein